MELEVFSAAAIAVGMLCSFVGFALYRSKFTTMCGVAFMASPILTGIGTVAACIAGMWIVGLFGALLCAMKLGAGYFRTGLARVRAKPEGKGV